MSPVTVLMIVLNGLFVLIAVQLAHIARSKNLPNLYWLALNYITAALGGFSLNFIPNPLPSILGFIVSSVFTVLFIHLTFYRDRKSPYLFFIGLIAVCGILQVWSTFSPVPGFSLTFLGYTLVWGWQAWLALTTHRHIASDRTVEDWVKGRYLLWMSYTLMMFILGIVDLLPIPSANTWSMISTIIVIISGFIQYLTWVMPEALRQYLNRKYQPLVSENVKVYMDMSEDELIQQIKRDTK